MTLQGIRIVVADDHPVFRDGLSALLGSCGAEVVGVATDGAEAVTLAVAHQPDVVVMDLNMPGTSGIDAIRRVTSAVPHVQVLALTMHEDDDWLFAAMRAGASGYVLKGASPEEITTAVEQLAGGAVVFGPAVAARVRSYFSGGQPRGDAFPELTPREHELLGLVAEGLDNATIAARLGIAHKTVKNHTSNIFTKLQVADRAQAIIRARDAGLGRT